MLYVVLTCKQSGKRLCIQFEPIYTGWLLENLFILNKKIRFIFVPRLYHLDTENAYVAKTAATCAASHGIYMLTIRIKSMNVHTFCPPQK